MGFNEQNTISNVFYAIVKGRFGKQSEIVKTYAKDILNLPHIPTSNVKKIHEFQDKLPYSVQSLETLNQLEAVNGTVSMTLEKLPAIRGDLVRNDPNWRIGTLFSLLRHCNSGPEDTQLTAINLMCDEETRAETWWLPVCNPAETSPDK